MTDMINIGTSEVNDVSKVNEASESNESDKANDVSEVNESNEANEDKVRIANEVIETMTGIVVSETGNVVSSGTGLVDGIAGILGRKNITKGIRVEINGNEVKIDISIVVNYGCKIHLVAKEIQNRVRETIENSTGLRVTEVNVNILGLNMEKESKKDEAIKEEVINKV